MTEILDLFGDPVPANWGGRGRPPHLPTQENRNRVKLLLALGWMNERIARALSITPNTLRKHYMRELKFRSDARDRLDARMADVLWKQCAEGNVAAIKEFQKLLERNDMMVGHKSFYDGQRETEEPKTPKLGKKEEAVLAAQTAGEDTEWGNDLKPPGVH